MTQRHANHEAGDSTAAAPTLGAVVGAIPGVNPGVIPGALAVVTGGSGFIGQALVRELIACGAKVRVLGRGRPRAGVGADAAAAQGAEFLTVDYANAAELARAVAGADYVFHLAGVTRALSLQAFRAGNVEVTRALLKAVNQTAHSVRRFVFVSSQAAAGPARARDVPVREEDFPAPVEAYGVSKLEAERVVAADARVPWTIVRPCSVYGPNDRDFLVVWRQVRLGVALYAGSRERCISILHVDDVVRGILLAAVAQSAVGQTYFLSSDEPLTWREIYHSAARSRLIEIDVPQPIVNLAGRIGDVVALVTGRVGLLNSNKAKLGQCAFWVCSAEKAHRQIEFSQTVFLRGVES